MQDSTFRLLFIGDVIGEAGRAAVRMLVPDLRRELNLDAVIANGENSPSGGEGHNAGDWLGVALDNRLPDSRQSRVRCRRGRNVSGTGAANNTTGKSGGGLARVRLRVVNVQGRVFMRHTPRSPFLWVERAVDKLEAAGADLLLVDVHAKATSEKQAIGYHLTGRAQAVVV